MKNKQYKWRLDFSKWESPSKKDKKDAKDHEECGCDDGSFNSMTIPIFGMINSCF